LCLPRLETVVQSLSSSERLSVPPRVVFLFRLTLPWLLAYFPVCDFFFCLEASFDWPLPSFFRCIELFRAAISLRNGVRQESAILVASRWIRSCKAWLLTGRSVSSSIAASSVACVWSASFAFLRREMQSSLSFFLLEVNLPSACDEAD
jgi:hypothetical protein